MEVGVKPKILLIAALGAAMFVFGMVLVVLTDQVAPYTRYLLPLPPISVAAYIYMLNKLLITPDDPTVSGERKALAKDALTQILVGTLVFLLLSIMMVGVLQTVPSSFRSDLASEKLLMIAVMGAAMLGTGALLYVLSERVAPHWRFLLPLPPIIVAAYTYVSNRIDVPDAIAGARTLPADIWDLTLQTLIGTGAYLAVVVLMLVGFSVAMGFESRRKTG